MRRGPMRPSELAEAEALNPTLLSRVLAHLEDRGLVLARAGPEGRPGDHRAQLPMGTA